jgi:hypothetical protein
MGKVVDSIGYIVPARSHPIGRDPHAHRFVIVTCRKRTARKEK